MLRVEVNGKDREVPVRPPPGAPRSSPLFFRLCIQIETGFMVRRGVSGKSVTTTAISENV